MIEALNKSKDNFLKRFLGHILLLAFRGVFSCQVLFLLFCCFEEDMVQVTAESDSDVVN